MPSTMLTGAVSGGSILVSGNILSGSYGITGIVGGLLLKLAASGPGPVFVGLPNLSGAATTQTSGGSLSSGGLADGLELWPGEFYFIDRVRLVSGIGTPKIIVPAASSGVRLYWEVDSRKY